MTELLALAEIVLHLNGKCEITAVGSRVEVSHLLCEPVVVECPVPPAITCTEACQAAHQTGGLVGEQVLACLARCAEASN